MADPDEVCCAGGSRAAEREAFEANHDLKTDEELLAPVPQPFTPLLMFVCTFEAVIGNVRAEVPALIEALRGKLRYPVVAVNSNFGNVYLPGHEGHVKLPKEVEEPQVLPGGIQPPIRKQRKLQGSGTCFNSAVEPVIVPSLDPRLAANIHDAVSDFALREGKTKVYKMKCFPSTGKSQVPGVIMPSFDDGEYVARAWAELLSSLPADAGIRRDPGRELAVAGTRPIMINYKFNLRRRSPRILLNLLELYEFLEGARAAAGADEPGAGKTQREVAEENNAKVRGQLERLRAAPKIVFLEMTSVMAAAGPAGARSESPERGPGPSPSPSPGSEEELFHAAELYGEERETPAPPRPSGQRFYAAALFEKVTEERLARWVACRGEVALGDPPGWYSDIVVDSDDLEWLDDEFLFAPEWRRWAVAKPPDLGAVRRAFEEAEEAARRQLVADLVPVEDLGPASARARYPVLPFPVGSITALQDDVKISFKFLLRGAEDTKKVRVNIFHRGKINILGANEHATAQVIYRFLRELLLSDWRRFVCIKPRPPKRPSEKREAAPAPSPEAKRALAQLEAHLEALRMGGDAGGDAGHLEPPV